MQSKIAVIGKSLGNDGGLLLLIGCASIGMQVCSYRSNQKHCEVLSREGGAGSVLKLWECNVVLGTEYALYAPFFLMLVLVGVHKVKCLKFASAVMLWLGIPWLMYICFAENDNSFRGASDTILYSNLLILMLTAFLILLNVIVNFAIFLYKKS